MRTRRAQRGRGSSRHPTTLYEYGFNHGLTRPSSGSEKTCPVPALQSSRIISRSSFARSPRNWKRSASAARTFKLRHERMRKEITEGTPASGAAIERLRSYARPCRSVVGRTGWLQSPARRDGHRSVDLHDRAVVAYRSCRRLLSPSATRNEGRPHGGITARVIVRCQNAARFCADSETDADFTRARTDGEHRISKATHPGLAL